MRESEGGEIVVDADYSDADRQMMKSMYVTDPNCKTVHKKTILSDISSGKEVAKSFDRAKRAMGVARRGYRMGEEGTIDSAVARAFSFSHNPSDQPNSAGDSLQSDNYCCVLVETRSPLDQTAKSKVNQMVVCEFQ